MKRRVGWRQRSQRAPDGWNGAAKRLIKRIRHRLYPKKVSELHTELGAAPKDGMTGSPVTEIGYKRNGRTRRGGPGNMSANRGGTTKLT